jgi:formiminotetrahydrofolate cyclodeaminase
VAAIALIVSIVIFVAGQLLVKRSEKQRLEREKKLQEAWELSEGRRIAREQMASIITRYNAYDELIRSPSPTAGSVSRRLEFIDEVLFECEYFGYLINTKEIQDENTVKFYKSRVNHFVSYMKDASTKLVEENKRLLEQNYPSIIGRHNEIMNGINEYWIEKEKSANQKHHG